MANMDLRNVIIPFQDTTSRWDLQVEDGLVNSLQPSKSTESDTNHTVNPPRLLLPSLCLPHIHLDKPYLLTCNHAPARGENQHKHPDYSDLAPRAGTFQEALKSTAGAKKRYTAEDLALRGTQLLATSYKQGVTSMRAFSEVDSVVGTLALAAGVRLKHDFAHLIDVQVCAFAQDAIFSGERGEENRRILASCFDKDCFPSFSSVDVLGTTPYVEASEEAARRNMDWAIETALKHNLHLDFHIEYNLQDDDGAGHIDYVLDSLLRNSWPTGPGARTIVLGHATRLTRASASDLDALSRKIKDSCLPVHFVGLPTSDLYMMGRPSSSSSSSPSASDASMCPHDRPRGSLNVPSLIKSYGLNACLSVNNVGNPFTPYGTGDPLSLASWCVGLHHAGTVADARLLYECVSTRARAAIGLASDNTGREDKVKRGERLRSMLLVDNENVIELPSPLPSAANDWKAASSVTSWHVPARLRLDIKDVVWDPPETRLRRVVPQCIEA